MSYAQLLAQVPIFENLQPEELEHLSAPPPAPGATRRVRSSSTRGTWAPPSSSSARGRWPSASAPPDGKEAILALLERGDFFGELALLDGEPRSTDAVAREETELLSLQRDDFHRFLASRPQVAMGLLASLSRLVRRVTQLVHDATFLDARTRLVRVLLELARSQGQPGADGVVITQKLTQRSWPTCAASPGRAPTSGCASTCARACSPTRGDRSPWSTPSG